MTPQQRQVLEDAEQSVFDSMTELADAQSTSGIRPPPLIEETESTLDPQLFGLDFAPQPEAESFPESSSLPFVCPSSATVTFFDVAIDCGCINIGGSSDQWTDISFNSTPVTLSQVTLCPSAPEPFCSLTLTGVTALHTRHKIWNVNNCSGTPITDDNPAYAAVDLIFFAGLWYLISSTFSPLLFYGTSPSLSATFINTVVCGGPNDYFIPVCPPGSTQSLLGRGHGGFATVTIP